MWKHVPTRKRKVRDILNGNNGNSQRNQLPPGSIRVGNGVGYPDSNGVIHSSPGAAIGSNQAIEKDQSRGASGACPQDSGSVPWRR